MKMLAVFCIAIVCLSVNASPVERVDLSRFVPAVRDAYNQAVDYYVMSGEVFATAEVNQILNYREEQDGDRIIHRFTLEFSFQYPDSEKVHHARCDVVVIEEDNKVKGRIAPHNCVNY